MQESQNSTVDATVSTFELEVLQSDLPVIVDFWAAWCGPCKVLGPTLEAVAETLKGKVKVVKVDVDSSPELAAQYGVRGIPTLLFFKEGAVTHASVGNISKTQLIELIEQHA